MAEMQTIFWNLDPAQFARMHQAEHKVRRCWLLEKIEDCEQLLAKHTTPSKLRLTILEDRTHYRELLEAMYEEQ